MLVLSRFKGEAIVVGGNVVIEVIDVRSSGQVRLGITAPKDVTVNRREIEIAIKEDQRRADAEGGRPMPRRKEHDESLAAILERAKNAPFPQVAENYDSGRFCLLIVLCQELQRASGAGPFFLSSRTAAKLLTKATGEPIRHSSVANWLNLLVFDCVLQLTKAGTKGKAASYRYLPKIEP